MKTLRQFLFHFLLTHCLYHFQMHLLPLTSLRRLGCFLGVKSGSFTDFSSTHLGFSLFLVCKILYCYSIYFLAFNILILLYPIVNILYIFVVLWLQRSHYIMEIFEEGVKMKADVHTLSLLFRVIPSIFCTIPFLV